MFLKYVTRLLDDAWNWIKEYFVEILIVGTIVIMLLLTGLLSADWFVTDKQVISGIIVSKEYVPAQSGVGVGRATDGSGSVIVVTSDSEKWTVVLLLDDGDYQSIEVSPETFYQLPESGPVRLDCRVGKIFGSISDCRMNTQ